MVRLVLVFMMFMTVVGCTPQTQEANEVEGDDLPLSESEKLLNKYTPFTLNADLSAYSDNQRDMLRLLIEASEIMDELFWEQAYGNKDALFDSLEGDEALTQFATWNYGPWDRLNNNEAFVPGHGPKPKGANFYPEDITKEEIESAGESQPALLSEYTIVRRNEDGELLALPYSEFYETRLEQAAQLLEAAAELAEDSGFAEYLKERAMAFRSNDYYASDMAWMDMKSNEIELVIGPIEHYEDALLGRKTAFEAYVLLKDMEWSERLEKYSSLLPGLQRNLPVPDAYKTEEPGTDSDLNAYTAIYYAGDCNAGSKTIAINLPNDERVQLAKGTRRLQIKNAMQAKFEKILLPIADVLIAEDQRDAITFDAFFANTMFHEVAHGLGIKNLVGAEGTVREALKERASALEEGKADVLGLFMVSQLIEQGEWSESTLRENYVTFVASIFRSIRFGASSAHGRANLARFNFFRSMGAFNFDEASGTYSVDFDKMPEAVDALSEKILKLQGDGDYDGVGAFMEEYGQMTDELSDALNRLSEAGIPVDIVFEQGKGVLGL